MHVAKYKDGLFIIYNSDKISTLDTEINNLESLIGRYLTNYHIGVSNIFSQVEQFNLCLKQAVLSKDLADVIGGKIVRYKDANVYKILYPFLENHNVQDFYKEVMKPLIDYDKHYEKFELVKTIEAYINYDGDYKRTALYLNQHENTVRYRVTKAKKILNLENNNFKFIEQVSIGLKHKNILDKKI